MVTWRVSTSASSAVFKFRLPIPRFLRFSFVLPPFAFLFLPRSIMEFILSTISGTIKITLLAIVSVGSYTAYTKPSRDSFIRHIKSESHVLASPLITVIEKTSNAFDYKDYVFFATVRVKIGDEGFFYVGAVNNWFYQGAGAGVVLHYTK